MSNYNYGTTKNIILKENLQKRAVKAKVVRVQDGDTIYVKSSDDIFKGTPPEEDGSYSIRLSGVQTPEGYSFWERKDENGEYLAYEDYVYKGFEQKEPFAEESFKFIKDLSFQKEIILDLRTRDDGSLVTGSFSRPIAICFVKTEDGEYINLNISLLINGLAEPYYIESMNISDGEKREWSSLTLIADMIKMEEDIQEDIDEFVGDFDPEKDIKIGDSILPIPPEAIKVSDINEVNPSGVLRNGSTLMSSTGHRQKQIQMEFYFDSNKKTKEVINGKIYEGDQVNGFPKRASGLYSRIKQDGEIIAPVYYINGLRPLLAQFKLTPFLPVENNYLNKAHEITSITLQNLIISNVEGFPGLLKATLIALEFNHQAYINSLSPFKDIFDWKLFRFYYQRIIEGTGIKHGGTKLPFYHSDGEDFSFFTVDSWSLQRRENLENSLKNMLREYQIDLKGGSTEYEKLVHDMEIFNEALEQKEIFEKMKDNYNLEDAISANELSLDYKEKIFSKNKVSSDLDLMLYFHNTEHRPNYADYNNLNTDEDFFVIRLRSEKNKEYLIKYIKETSENRLLASEIREIKMASDKKIEKIKENDPMVLAISKNTFSEIKNRIMGAGADVDKEREDVLNMAEDQMEEYQWNKRHYKGLYLNQISVSMSNKVNTLKLNMQQKPAHQYLGSKDIIISASFIAQDDEVIKGINFLASQISALELRYKNILDNPVLKIKNNITDMFGLDGAYIKNIETNTIPGMPGLKQVEISFFGYFSAEKEKDSLSLKYQTELGVDGKLGEDSLTDYFNIKEQMQFINLYPDLELPRYSELPISHPLYDENDESFVDPDFYALNVPKLFLEDVAKSVFGKTVHKKIGRDYQGNVVTATVNNDGELKINNSNIEGKKESINLYQAAQEYDNLDYNVLNQFVKEQDDLSKISNSNTFVSEDEFNNYISKADWTRKLRVQKIKIKNLWKNHHMKQVFDVAEGGILGRGGAIPEIEKIILSGFVIGRWDEELKDDEILETTDYSLYKDANGIKTESKDFAQAIGVLGLPKSIVGRKNIEKIASDYRANILKLELEAGNIYNVLKEGAPDITFEDDKDTVKSLKSYHKNSKKRYIDYLFKMLSYFLVFGISLNQVAENSGNFSAMANQIKRGYLQLDKNASSVVGGSMYMAPTEMIDILPEFSTLIMESLSSINGENLLLKTNGSLLQSRKEDIRFKSSFNDMMEYDKRGRLIRAFPSYYMMLVDEGREFMFWKMQDLFYEYNGVESIDVVRDKKNVADTCMITMSNSKGNLSDAAGGFRKKYFNENGVMETLWSLTPFAEFEWEKKKRESAPETVQLAAGARIHLRIGYGSTPDKLPTVFNGTITELQLGDTITFVAQNDGIELNKPIPASPNEKTDFEVFGTLDEPKTIISKILGNKGNLWAKFMNKISSNVLYNESLYGVQHFGAVKRPDWWEESSHILMRHPSEDIYINRYDLEKEVDIEVEEKERGFEINQNINSSLYKNKEISMYLYGKTIWDMLQASALVAPNYIAAIHPFAFRNTIFYGHPNFDFAYDYESEKDENGNYKRKEAKIEDREMYFSANGYKKEFKLGINIEKESLRVYDGSRNITENIDKIDYKNGVVKFKKAPEDGYRNLKFVFKTLLKGKIDPTNVREKLKSYRQMHFYSSFYDIIANNIKATDKNMYTVVKPVLSKDGSYEELDEMFVDTDIFPSNQKLKKIDTSIPTPDFLRNLLESVRIFKKNAEINAQRYGAGALKQSVQNMYEGEIIVTGDPSVKPYDYSYLADIATRMNGTFEVSAVVHSLNNTTGFISSIKPSPIVSVNEGLDTDMKFWNWSKSKFSQIYADSVVARISAYTALNTLKTVINSVGLDAANGLLPATQAGRALNSYLDIANDFTRHSNLGYLPYLLGESAVNKIKDIGTKTDDIVLWMQRFLDNSNKMIATEYATKASAASSKIGSFRNGYLRVFNYISEAYDNVDDFPGFIRDINKYKKIRKGGQASVDILGDVKVFKRMLTYGMQGGQNIAQIASGPIGFLAMELIEMVIVGKIMDFFNNVRNNREVLTIVPLKHNGHEFTAGLDGHKGCVIGDDPSEMDEFWEGSLISFFLGESKTSDNRSRMRDSLIEQQEAILGASEIYGLSQKSDVERRVLGINNPQDVKKVFEETTATNFKSAEELELDKIKISNSSKSESDDEEREIELVKKMEEENKKKTEEIQSLKDIDFKSRSEWIRKAVIFVRENDEVLREYDGFKLHPSLISFIDYTAGQISKNDVKIIFGESSRGAQNMDTALFKNGLAVKFEPVTKHNKYKRIDITDVVTIIKTAAAFDLSSIKIYGDNSVQVDMFPLNDKEKLKTEEYNMSSRGLSEDVLEVIDTYF